MCGWPEGVHVRLSDKKKSTNVSVDVSSSLELTNRKNACPEKRTVNLYVTNSGAKKNEVSMFKGIVLKSQ